MDTVFDTISYINVKTYNRNYIVISCSIIRYNVYQYNNIENDNVSNDTYDIFIIKYIIKLSSIMMH